MSVGLDMGKWKLENHFIVDPLASHAKNVFIFCAVVVVIFSAKISNDRPFVALSSCITDCYDKSAKRSHALFLGSRIERN